MFFITTFTKMEKTDLGCPDVGSSRTVGFVETFEEADQILKSNSCDIWETIYNWANIEEIGPGIYYFPDNVWWYKWDDEKHGFFPTEKPECTKGMCNFSIG
jgi:hypothetical protein